MRFLSFQSFLLATSLLVSPAVFAGEDSEQLLPLPTRKWEDFLGNFAWDESENLAGIILDMDKDNQERTFGALSIVLQDRLDHNRRDPERIQNILHSVRLNPEWAAQNTSSRFDALLASYSAPAPSFSFWGDPYDTFSATHSATAINSMNFSPFSPDFELSYGGSMYSTYDRMGLYGDQLNHSPAKNQKLLEAVSADTVSPATRQAFTDARVKLTEENIRNLDQKTEFVFDDTHSVDENLTTLLQKTQQMAEEANLSVDEYVRMTKEQVKGAHRVSQGYQQGLLTLDSHTPKRDLEWAGWNEQESEAFLEKLRTTPQAPRAFKQEGLDVNAATINHLVQNLGLQDFDPAPSDHTLIFLLRQAREEALRLNIPVNEYTRMPPKQIQAARDLENWIYNRYLTLSDADGQSEAQKILIAGDWSEDAITSYVAKLTQNQAVAAPAAFASDAPTAFVAAGLTFTPTEVRRLALLLGEKVPGYIDYSLTDLLRRAQEKARATDLPWERWTRLTPEQTLAADDLEKWRNSYSYLDLHIANDYNAAEKMLREGGWSVEEMTPYLEALRTKQLPSSKWDREEIVPLLAGFSQANIEFTPKSLRQLARELEEENFNNYYRDTLTELLEKATRVRTTALLLGAYPDRTSSQIEAAQDVTDWARHHYLNLKDASDISTAQQILTNGGWAEGDARNYLRDIVTNYPQEGGWNKPEARAAFEEVNIPFTPETMRLIAKNVYGKNPYNYNNNALKEVFYAANRGTQETNLLMEDYLSTPARSAAAARNVMDWMNNLGYINPRTEAGLSLAIRILQEGDWEDMQKIGAYITRLATKYAPPAETPLSPAAYAAAGIDFVTPYQLYQLGNEWDPTTLTFPINRWDHSDANLMKILEILKERKNRAQDERKS